MEREGAVLRTVPFRFLWGNFEFMREIVNLDRTGRDPLLAAHGARRRKSCFAYNLILRMSSYSMEKLPL